MSEREISLDSNRLDFIEQLTDDNFIIELVKKWTVNHRRYSQGIRAAIDAALEEGY